MTAQTAKQSALPTLKDAHWLRCADTQAVLSLIEQGGFEARIVGGAVRNALLGKPIKDIDIATTAAPDAILELAARKSFRAIATGLEHGTVTVVSGDSAFEVTTLRKDVSTDGRHAVVAFTHDWLADAQRRDFTINAMYCDRHGNLFDPVNGYADIQARQVRFVGDPKQRIEEDYLRSLRFFRFFAEYGEGSPDAASLSEIVNCRAGLRRLSGERIRQEFLKILVAPRAVEIIQTMHDHGLLAYVLPVVPRLNHFARLCGCYPVSTADLRLGVLAVCTHEDSQQVTRKLKLSKAQTRVLDHTAAIFSQLDTRPSSKLGRRWLYEDGEELFLARVSLCETSSLKQISDPNWSQLYNLPAIWNVPTFPLSGRMAIELGAQPGPQMGTLLASLKQKWIESDFTLTTDQLVVMLIERLVAE